MTKKYSKLSLNITTFSIPRPPKFYPNWYFWFENKPSGNPEFGLLRRKMFFFSSFRRLSDLIINVGRRSNVEVQVAGWQNVERLPKMLTF
jgi:hypothetical protein